MLDERQTRRRFEVIDLSMFSERIFFFPLMWRVIRCNNVKLIIEQCFQKFLLVSCIFNCGVALDLRTELFVIAAVKPQVMNTNFCGDLFLPERNCVPEENCFFLRRNMENMQS